MKFVSTQGAAPAVNIIAALQNNMAPDAGLYIPETFPQIKIEDFYIDDYGLFANALLSQFIDSAELPFIGNL